MSTSSARKRSSRFSESVFIQRMNLEAYRQLGDIADAQDVVQEALVALLANKEEPCLEARDSDFVQGVLRHKVLDILRARRRIERLHGELLEQASLERDGAYGGTAGPHALTGPEYRVDLLQRVAALNSVLGTLSRRKKMAFFLRAEHDYDARETGACLGLSVGSTWGLWSRLRPYLQAELELRTGLQRED